MGLIRARLQGAREAQGDVLIFLGECLFILSYWAYLTKQVILIFLKLSDAHCEATKDWIEPLLSRIEEDHTAVLVPIIDVIEASNMGYSTNGNWVFIANIISV